MLHSNFEQMLFNRAHKTHNSQKSTKNETKKEKEREREKNKKRDAQLSLLFAGLCKTSALFAISHYS